MRRALTLKPRTTAAGNRYDACSDVDDANQSAPESTCGYMERNRVSLHPSREEDDEGKQISYRSTLRTELRQRRRRRRRPEHLEEGRRVTPSTLRCRDPPRSRGVEGVEGNPSAI